MVLTNSNNQAATRGGNRKEDEKKEKKYFLKAALGTALERASLRQDWNKQTSLKICYTKKHEELEQPVYCSCRGETAGHTRYFHADGLRAVQHFKLR